jgi:hypothetical protein
MDRTKEHGEGVAWCETSPGGLHIQDDNLVKVLLGHVPVTCRAVRLHRARVGAGARAGVGGCLGGAFFDTDRPGGMQWSQNRRGGGDSVRSRGGGEQRQIGAQCADRADRTEGCRWSCADERAKRGDRSA